MEGWRGGGGVESWSGGGWDGEVVEGWGGGVSGGGLEWCRVGGGVRVGVAEGW